MFPSTNTYLSAHFSLADALKSDTADKKAINNDASPAIIAVMTEAASGMEKIRVMLGNKPIAINSWYRCPELNTAVGSAYTSQHLKGEAIDWTCAEFGTPEEVCKFLIEHLEELSIDQIILEHTWIHVSFAILSRKPRYQVLSLLEHGTYSTGLTDKQGNKL